MGIDAVLDPNNGYDITIDSNGDIKTADQFDTAIYMSLFCERRAAPSEVPVPHLRRGWIGNVATPGFEIGSKLWLYEQARLTKTIMNNIAAEALSGLRWMVEDGIALKIDSVATVSEGLKVTLTRPNSTIATRFYSIWEGTGNAA